MRLEIVLAAARNRVCGGPWHAASLFRRLARAGSAIPVGEALCGQTQGDDHVSGEPPSSPDLFASLWIAGRRVGQSGHCGAAGRGRRSFPLPCQPARCAAGRAGAAAELRHQTAETPYRSRYAIFVIEGAEEARLAPGELPQVFQRRPIALRAFSEAGMLLEAGMGMGEDVASVIERLLANPEVSYLHAHNAMHGCYAARIDRA